MAVKANYAFKPIAEQALRPNQTIVPQRLNAALGLFGGSVRTDMIHEDLAAMLKIELARFGYNGGPETLPIAGIKSVLLSCQDIMRVRYLCAVMTVPPGFSAKDASQLLRVARRELSKLYAEFPYWKGLGTFLVWVCHEQEYLRLEPSVSTLYDHTGLHLVNTFLGTVLVCPETGATQGRCAWGLLVTGENFSAIQTIVGLWAKRKAGGVSEA